MSRVWLQVSSGRGPAECAWVVHQLLPLVEQDATQHGLHVELLECVEGEKPKTYLSVLLAIEGDAAEAWIPQWEGSIQWVGKSPFRPNHKRKNWFVGIDSYVPPASQEWDMKDLRIETMRASGPGGQHVNTTDSAVRITHIPSGATATAREERSQRQNKKLALARLSQVMKQQEQQAKDNVQQERWTQHNELERGNPTRVYKDESFRLKKTNVV